MITQNKTVFIVDDEEKIVEILNKYAIAEGYHTRTFLTGAEVVEQVKADAPDAILLDVMLPDQSGIDICKAIRKFSDVPILMVSAKVDEIDRLLGLELGADDYICKPFSPREVMARIKTVLRRTEKNLETSPSFQEATGHSLDNSLDNRLENTQGLSVSTQSHQATLNGQKLTLTPVEFRILCALNESPIRPWNRNQLQDRMYSDHRQVSDRTVDSHVANLRKKLQTLSPESECIESIYGVGYRLKPF